VEELAQLVEGLGMKAAELTSCTGEPVGTGVGQVCSLTQFVRRDATRRHEFMHSESDHNTFRMRPRVP